MSLDRVRDRLAELASRRAVDAYRVPGVWLDPAAGRDAVRVEPVDWWREVVTRALGARERPADRCPGGSWSRDAVVYSLFVRTAAAFDHDGDGQVEALNRRGFRETGTFIKAMALLPYIRDIGCDTVHLLPVSSIGRHGRKGVLGSPYAIRNPYRLDETLAEPALGLGAEVEFGAFVEAAGRLGLRVMLEFALRTAAKDSDWVGEAPAWFYWILDDAPFHAPSFSAVELSAIKRKIARGERAELPEPPASYRTLFVPPRALQAVARQGDRWVGRTADGTRVRIPGAFSDWPPDDVQPPWDDVTYLRLYDHPAFDYMAYNTLRMYDRRLARPEHAVGPLWDRIADIVPYYVRRFGIDGALIDMGHALPEPLKRRVIEGTRALDPGFVFWDEAFEATKRTRDEGYDAVVGDFWWSIHRPRELNQGLLERLDREGVTLPFLATPETHNTPRCAAREGGSARCRWAWTLGGFLPAVPWVHCGFEFGETEPINTGLDFTAEEIARYPSERLGLYGPATLAWTEPHDERAMIRRVLSVRMAFRDLVTDPAASSFSRLDLPDEGTVGYARIGRGVAIAVVGRFGEAGPAEVACDVPCTDGTYADPFTGRLHRVLGGRAELALRPWEVAVLIEDRIGRASGERR